MLRTCPFDPRETTRSGLVYNQCPPAGYVGERLTGDHVHAYVRTSSLFFGGGAGYCYRAPNRVTGPQHHGLQLIYGGFYWSQWSVVGNVVSQWWDNTSNLGQTRGSINTTSHFLCFTQSRTGWGPCDVLVKDSLGPLSGGGGGLPLCVCGWLCALDKIVTIYVLKKVNSGDLLYIRT